MTSTAEVAHVNDNATGVWATRIGQELELLGPGANDRHVLVRRPGERKVFGMPVKWLDGLEPEPERCPTCGRIMEEGHGD